MRSEASIHAEEAKDEPTERLHKTQLKLFSVLTLLIILTVGAVGYWFCRQALPIHDGIVTVCELDQSARVRYDQSAVPYIQAASFKDLNCAQGYVTASERLFQMDVLRRMAQGELSEVFGGTCLAHDKLVRTIGFNRLAKQDLTQLSAEAKSNLKAYCQGINSYINQNSNHLAIEFLLLGYQPKLWQPQDTLAILKFLQYKLDESWRLDEFRGRIISKAGTKLAARMFEQNFQSWQTKTSLAPLPNWPSTISIGPSNLSCGSNAWVIASNLSSTHACLLACDKHSSFTSPDIWFTCGLQSPGFHALGATIPGVPGIIIGRNENIAWAMTSLKADVQDLYIEQFSDKFPGKYKVPGGWSTARVITEEIPQRFAGGLLEKILETRHGPILLRNDTSAIALSWSGFKASGPVLETIWQLNKAGNWTDFRLTLAKYKGGPHLFLYADRQGHIGWQAAGIIPIRKCDTKYKNYSISNGSTILPGWTDDCAWTDYFKFDDLPYSFNPADQFAVANDPRYAFISNNNNTTAAQRVSAILSNFKNTGQHPDLPEMSALQGDEFAHLNKLVKSEVANALQHTQNIDKYNQQALSRLSKWDGQLSPDSSAACVYESFLTTFLYRILEPKLGHDLTNEYVERWPKWTNFVARVLKERPSELLPPAERTYETFIVSTLAESLKNLRIALKASQPQTWVWKDLHKVDFGEFTHNFGLGFAPTFLFAPGPIGVGGDQDCVNACNLELNRAPWCFLCTAGPTERTVIDLSDQDKFYQGITLGQSEHILSNHKFDQMKSWLNNEPHAVAFSDNQIQLQMQHSLILSNRYQ